MRLTEIIKLTWIPVIGASLCCVSPIIVVLLGLGTVSFASSLADTLYGEYKWVFRILGILLLLVALVVHFRRKGICTLHQAKRHRNEILNTMLLSLTFAVLGYIIFLYVIVHYWGVWLQLWS